MEFRPEGPEERKEDDRNEGQKKCGMSTTKTRKEGHDRARHRVEEFHFRNEKGHGADSKRAFFEKSDTIFFFFTLMSGPSSKELWQRCLDLVADATMTAMKPAADFAFFVLRQAWLAGDLVNSNGVTINALQLHPHGMTEKCRLSGLAADCEICAENYKSLISAKFPDGHKNVAPFTEEQKAVCDWEVLCSPGGNQNNHLQLMKLFGASLGTAGSGTDPDHFAVDAFYLTMAHCPLLRDKEDTSFKDALLALKTFRNDIAMHVKKSGEEFAVTLSDVQNGQMIVLRVIKELEELVYRLEGKYPAHIDPARTAECLAAFAEARTMTPKIADGSVHVAQAKQILLRQFVSPLFSATKDTSEQRIRAQQGSVGKGISLLSSTKYPAVPHIDLVKDWPAGKTEIVIGRGLPSDGVDIQAIDDDISKRHLVIKRRLDGTLAVSRHPDASLDTFVDKTECTAGMEITLELEHNIIMGLPGKKKPRFICE
jgi:hypothetical protein